MIGIAFSFLAILGMAAFLVVARRRQRASIEDEYSKPRAWVTEPSHIRACNACGSRPSYVREGELCDFPPCTGAYVRDAGEPEPLPLPKPEELDPNTQLLELVERANAMAGGRYLAINVGPSRHERRAKKALERRAKKGRAA